MNTAEIITFGDCNYWAIHRILRAASELTADKFRAPTPLSRGGVHYGLARAAEKDNRPLHFHTIRPLTQVTTGGLTTRRPRQK